MAEQLVELEAEYVQRIAKIEEITLSIEEAEKCKVAVQILNNMQLNSMIVEFTDNYFTN